MNDILERQRESRFVRMLGAQAQLYDEFKFRKGIWWAGTLLIALLGASLVPFFATYTIYITLLASLVALLEALIAEWIKSRQTLAARIQEKYDCELLRMSWNPVLTKEPESETIEDAAQDYFKHAPPSEEARFATWYSKSIDGLPLNVARLICQRENLWWDASQRKDFRIAIWSSLVILFFVLQAIGIAADWSTSEFWAGPFLLSLPLFVNGIKNGLAHERAINRLNELRDFAVTVAKQIYRGEISADLADEYARMLQTQIFLHRKSNPSVPTWFYNLRKDHYQRLANAKNTFSLE